VGPDEDAGGNVADNKRQAQRARAESSDQAREYDQNEIGCDAQFFSVAPGVWGEGRRAALAVIWLRSRDWRPTARRRAGQTLPGP